VADSLGSPFLSAHIHKQVAGTPGGIVLDIGSSFHFDSDSVSGLTASGMWLATQANQPLTRALAKALIAESLYVNVHSKTNSGGEIRGQIKDRVPDNRQAIVGIARMARGTASAAKASFGAGGLTFRLRGEPARSLRFSIRDPRGKLEYQAVLRIESGGYSRPVDLGALAPGLHVAAWNGSGARGSARFLRH
jgi:hypothetical protein